MSRPCPVCGGLETEQMHQHRLVLFAGHPLPELCSIVICANCGFCFNNSVASADSYFEYYKTLSKYAPKSSDSSEDQIYAKVSDIFQSVCSDRRLSILDAGCGSGGLLTKLQTLGYKNLSALDPSPAGIEKLKLFGIEAKVGTLAEPPFKPDSFDVVISTGVLEHLLHPTQDLQNIRKMLSPETNYGAFIVVPDASRYADFLNSPYQEFNIEHINHFSPTTLSTLFNSNSWTSVTTGQNSLNVTEDWIDPVIYGLFKPNSSNKKYQFSADTNLKSSISRYITESDILLKNIEDKLKYDLIDESEVVIWGAGQLTSLLFGETSLKNKKIHCVIDNNKLYDGHQLRNIPVGGSNLKGSFDGPIVISSIRHYHEIETFIKQELKWKNKLISLLV